MSLDQSFQQLAATLQQVANQSDTKQVAATAYAQGKINDAMMGAMFKLLKARGWMTQADIERELEAAFKAKIAEATAPQIVIPSGINGSKR